MTTPKLNPPEASIFANGVSVNIEADQVILDFVQASSDDPVQRIIMARETADLLRESLDFHQATDVATDASARLQALFERLDALPDDDEGLTYESLRELRREADKRLDRLYGTSDR